MELDRGYLLAFEGVDGTGKSTHCKRLGEYLKKRGLPVLCLSEPTQGVWGQKIREILNKGRQGISPEEELDLFIKDRKEDVERNIGPALAEKKIVLIDRYYYSTAAYQGALGLDPESICRENERFAPAPNRVFIFVTPLETCLERIRKTRDSGTDSFEKLDYLKKVQRIFDTFTGPRFHRIDSSGPEDTVHAQLLKPINELFSL